MASERDILLADGREMGVPSGFRFRPTDEELLVLYLKPKVLSVPPPALVIPELDMFETSPWYLPGDLMQRMLFFCRIAERMSPTLDDKNEEAAVAAVLDCSGYWKLVGNDEAIIASGSNQVIGMKRHFVFCEWEASDCAELQWIMHELRLLGAHTGSGSTQFGKDTVPAAADKGEGEWAVYRVFQEKGKQQRKLKRGKGTVSVPPAAIDFMNEVEDLMGIGSGSCPPPSPPPSPSSSLANHDLED